MYVHVAEIMLVKHLFDASHRFSGSYTAKKKKKKTTWKSLTGITSY